MALKPGKKSLPKKKDHKSAGSAMSDVPLHARSRREIELFFAVMPCPACRQGTLSPVNPPDFKTPIASFEALCGRCAATRNYYFELSNDPRDRPSRLIDIAQWLTLHGMFLETAKFESNKARARTIALQAAECLDESLKFFDDPENDLPPVSAFFDQTSLLRFRENPQQFSRARILGLRRSLPNTYRGRPA